jgi:hypothetical protein
LLASSKVWRRCPSFRYGGSWLALAPSLGSFHPIAVTSIPPATQTAGIETPKNSDQRPEQEPKAVGCTSSTSRFLCCGVQSAVRLRKIGADPSGFTTGNRPAKTRRKAFEISFTARSSLNATAQSFGNKAANGGSLHAQLAIQPQCATASRV